MDDIVAKRRMALGEQNGRAKLTRDQVLEIRVLVDNGKRTKFLRNNIAYT